METTLADLELPNLGVIIFFDDTPVADGATAAYQPTSLSKATAQQPEKALKIKL